MKLMKVMSEARFLAGEDARGVLVVLEPETELTREHLDALRDCGAAGFVSDFTPARFEQPDAVPTLEYDRARYAMLLGLAVSPRVGVHLRTWAAKGEVGFRLRVQDDGAVEFVTPAPVVKRDRTHDPDVTKEEILAALARIGVTKGDTLMVHSSLSACGHIVGGAQTVIEALIEAVGEDGNFFLPSYQRSECFLNGAISTRWDHRPSDFNARASASIKWIGSIPLAFMRLYPDAPRGRHISHSWTGWGKQAAAVLSAQAWDEPPFSGNSAPYKVMEMGGKILHFGSPICRTSFIHCLEHHFHLPGHGGPAFFQVLLPDGQMIWKGLEGSFCGRRESTLLNEKARFYQEAFKEGLILKKEPLGVGTLMLMDCHNLWDVGAKVVQRDPTINLILEDK